MHYTPIVSSLGYVLSKDRTKVLLVHRNKDPDHDQWNLYNGLGGKMEPGEDPVSCVKREVYEESGLQCDELSLKGTVIWKNFGKFGQDWLGFVFIITSFTGTPYSSNSEGDVKWIPIKDLDKYPMGEGDSHFLGHVFSQDARNFCAHFEFENCALVKHKIELL